MFHNTSATVTGSKVEEKNVDKMIYDDDSNALVDHSSLIETDVSNNLATNNSDSSGDILTAMHSSTVSGNGHTSYQRNISTSSTHHTTPSNADTSSVPSSSAAALHHVTTSKVPESTSSSRNVKVASAYWQTRSVTKDSAAGDITSPSTVTSITSASTSTVLPVLTDPMEHMQHSHGSALSSTTANGVNSTDSTTSSTTAPSGHEVLSTASSVFITNSASSSVARGTHPASGAGITPTVVADRGITARLVDNVSVEITIISPGNAVDGKGNGNGTAPVAADVHVDHARIAAPVTLAVLFGVISIVVVILVIVLVRRNQHGSRQVHRKSRTANGPQMSYTSVPNRVYNGLSGSSEKSSFASDAIQAVVDRSRKIVSSSRPGSTSQPDEILLLPRGPPQPDHTFPFDEDNTSIHSDSLDELDRPVHVVTNVSLLFPEIAENIIRKSTVSDSTDGYSSVNILHGGSIRGSGIRPESVGQENVYLFPSCHAHQDFGPNWQPFHPYDPVYVPGTDAEENEECDNRRNIPSFHEYACVYVPGRKTVESTDLKLPEMPDGGGINRDPVHVSGLSGLGTTELVDNRTSSDDTKPFHVYDTVYVPTTDVDSVRQTSSRSNEVNTTVTVPTFHEYDAVYVPSSDSDTTPGQPSVNDTRINADNRAQPFHDYDPVYVPRYDADGMDRRVDNETSYITSTRARLGLNSYEEIRPGLRPMLSNPPAVLIAARAPIPPPVRERSPVAPPRITSVNPERSREPPSSEPVGATAAASGRVTVRPSISFNGSETGSSESPYETIDISVSR